MKKIMLLLICIFLGTSVVNAASFTITAGSKSLSKGNTTKLTIKGSDVTGRFNISTSNASVVSISEDRAWIENNSYGITLSALSVGTATITVTPVGVSDGSGNAVSLGAKTIKITVSLPREKDTDNTLKSLGVEGYEISPEFNKDTLDYTVSVPEGTTNVKVVATANSKYASVTGTGDTEVTEGVNNLSVVVKSETGVDRIYNLVVNVIDQNPINVTVDKINYTLVKLRKNYTCIDNFTENDIVIDNISIPACYNSKIDYTLVGLKKDDGTIENFVYKDGKYTKYNELTGTSIKLINEPYDGNIEGLIKSTLTIDGINYQVFKFNEKSKYSVIYGMNIITGEKDLYVYDSVNKTFSGYDTEFIDYLKHQNEIYLYVIIAFGSGLFLSLICIIILDSKKKKLKKQFKNNNEVKENKKNDKKDKIEEEIVEDKKEDVNDIQEISNESDATETYYLFEKDRKKKHKKK